MDSGIKHFMFQTKECENWRNDGEVNKSAKL